MNERSPFHLFLGRNRSFVMPIFSSILRLTKDNFRQKLDPLTFSEKQWQNNKYKTEATRYKDLYYASIEKQDFKSSKQIYEIPKTHQAAQRALRNARSQIIKVSSIPNHTAHVTISSVANLYWTCLVYNSIYVLSHSQREISALQDWKMIGKTWTYSSA